MKNLKKQILLLTLGLSLFLTPAQILASDELMEITEAEAQNYKPVYNDETYDAYQKNNQNNNSFQDVYEQNNNIATNPLNTSENMQMSSEMTSNDGYNMSAGSVISADSNKQVNLSEKEWSPNENFIFSGTVNITTETHKFEIIYTSSEMLPEVLFQSPSRTIYEGKPEKNVENGDEMFVTRSGYYVTGHPDLKVMYIYIAGTHDPGPWTMQVQFPADTKEFFIIESQEVSDWKTLNAEYMTNATDIVQWYIAERTLPDDEKTYLASSYTVNDIALLIVAEPRPSVNDIQEAPEVVENESVNVPLIIIISVLVLGVIIIVVFFYIKNRTIKENDIRKKNSIKLANLKILGKKKKENETLDDYVAKFDEEYNDDDVDEDAHLYDEGYEEYGVEEDINYKDKEYAQAPWEDNDDEQLNNIDDNVDDIDTTADSDFPFDEVDKKEGNEENEDVNVEDFETDLKSLKSKDISTERDVNKNTDIFDDLDSLLTSNKSETTKKSDDIKKEDTYLENKEHKKKKNEEKSKETKNKPLYSEDDTPLWATTIIDSNNRWKDNEKNNNSFF